MIRFLFVGELEKSLLLSIGDSKKTVQLDSNGSMVTNRFHWSDKFSIR